MGRRVFRNYYEGNMEKTKGKGGSKGWKWVWLGLGGNSGEKIQSSVTEQQ